MRQKSKSLFDDVDAVLIYNAPSADPNFWYFSQLHSAPFEHSLLVKTDRSLTALVPLMEFGLAKSQADYNVIGFKDRDDFANKLSVLFKGKKRIGVNYSWMSVAGLNHFKKLMKGKRFIDISQQLSEMRSVKSVDESRHIQSACSITSKVMSEIPDFASAGVTERSIAAEIERRMKGYRADDIAFTTIVASGWNSANPHYFAGDKKLKKGDLVIMDFGCKVRNYCSDMTRTFVVGKGNEKQKMIHDLCLEMQKDSVSMLKAGVPASEIAIAADRIAVECGYNPMIHGLGHGIGVQIHESPSLNRKSKDILKVGNVVTVEPGIYLPRFGGVRIEDDYLVTKKGAKPLTRASKELIEI